MLFNSKYISVKISESKMKQRNEELSLLLEMSNFLSISMDLNDILEGALAKVLEHFDLDAGRIYLLDDESQSFYLAAHRGLEPEGLETLGFDEGFSGRAARTKSFIAQHVTELADKKRAGLLLSKGFRIIICAPLIALGKVVGVMNLASRNIISLDQNRIDLCIAIGNLIAIAANNANTYELLQCKIETLKEKKDTIKFFAYSISHDLKSPAVGIHALTKRLQEKYEHFFDEKGKAHCDQIVKASEKMTALVETINTYISTKEAPLNMEKVKIKEITEEIRDQFYNQLHKRKINWSEPDTLPVIVADRLSLLRVFQNFVDNALKYGGKDLLKIEIGHEERDGFHIFSFSDDGVGIKGENKEDIFELFHRNETSHGTAGSGLGLAIVKEIAERHRGKVWVDFDTSKGTTFYISIPNNLEIPG